LESGTRNKIDKIANNSARKQHEDDAPDNLYLVVEGKVQIIKEVLIVTRNRWPIALNEWRGRGMAKKRVCSFPVNELGRENYFGELAITKQSMRHASAYAKTRVLVLALDKLEFLHLINNTQECVIDQNINYSDREDMVQHIISTVGGEPSSRRWDRRRV
jgi:CRP-like cAMP-binding protein